MIKALKTPLASMQYGSEDFLSELVAQACGKLDTRTLYTGNLEKFVVKIFHS